MLFIRLLFSIYYLYFIFYLHFYIRVSIPLRIYFQHASCTRKRCISFIKCYATMIFPRNALRFVIVIVIEYFSTYLSINIGYVVTFYLTITFVFVIHLTDNHHVVNFYAFLIFFLEFFRSSNLHPLALWKNARNKTSLYLYFCW